MEKPSDGEKVPVVFATKMALFICASMRMIEAFKRAKKGDMSWSTFTHYVGAVTDALDEVRGRSHKMHRAEKRYWEKKFDLPIDLK